MSENNKSENNDAVPTAPPIPDWIQSKLFEPLLKENISDFKSIKNFKVKSALPPGENYSTMMLRVEIDVELIDGKIKTVSYMLKLPHDLEIIQEFMKIINPFITEMKAYSETVRDFEQMYKEAGVDLKFGPKMFTLNTEKYYLLLEDLRPAGFKNANRLEGLNMEHTKCVLKKLAQWHAASAVYVETKGKFDDIYINGIFTEKNRDLMKSVQQPLQNAFLRSVKKFAGYEVYGESIEKLSPKFVDIYVDINKINPNEFNVLNHGDCWTNNIMFQYDAFGKIKETYFVDLQLFKYGTPAYDLYYFLLSSTNYDIKLKHFDYFIKYYFDNLIENLILLKYPKKLPTLKEIHMILFKYGVWGYGAVTVLMAPVLMDSTENSNLDNFLTESDVGIKFKLLMYSNNRYRKNCEAILPWLYNRGALDY